MGWKDTIMAMLAAVTFTPLLAFSGPNPVPMPDWILLCFPVGMACMYIFDKATKG